MLYSGINLIPIYAEITPLSIHSADLLPAHTGQGHPLKTERKHHAPQKDSQVSSTDKLRH